jgi:hypothetical protein
MQLDKLKRWQWALIGLFLGAILGGMQGYVAQTMPDAGVDESLTQRAFEDDLLKENYLHQHPFFTNLVIKPWNGQLLVLGTYFREHRERQIGPDSKPKMVTKVYQRNFRYVPRTPYKPTRRFPGPHDPNLTVRGFLDHVQKTHPEAKLAYSYAWWSVPKVQVAIWSAGGLVVGGLIWPTIVNLLTFGSVFRPKEPKDESQLSAYGQGEVKRPVPAAAVSDEGLHQHIQTLEAELEGSMQSRGPEEEEEEEIPAIRPLNAAPQAPAPTQAAPPPKREFGGQFYPTVAHAPKRDGD